MYEFRLYVVGRTPRSEKAVETLKAILSHSIRNGHDLEVIDLMANPDEAERDGIIATPTLVKASPPPVRKVIGDFSNAEKVAKILGLGEEP